MYNVVSILALMLVYAAPGTTVRQVNAQNKGMPATDAKSAGSDDAKLTIAGRSTPPLKCGPNETPGFVHAFVATFDEGEYSLEKAEKLSKEYNGVIQHVKRRAGLANAAVSRGEDPDPDASGSKLASNRFGGFLLFQDMPDRPGSPVDGAELYWASQPHQDFVKTFLDTVSVDDDGRAAASIQLSACVPKDYSSKPTGRYHFGVIVDINEDAANPIKKCVVKLGELPRKLESKAKKHPAVPSIYDQQWADYKMLAFSDDLDNGDRNKANDPYDVGVIFNFDSRNERDAFLELAEETLDNADAEKKDCIKNIWFWKME